MQKAVNNLLPRPQRILIDGNRAPRLSGDVRTVIQGDRLVPVISAASILAKVSRDRCMHRWHEEYPQYGFNQHKGYGTPGHLQKLERYGPCAIHRRSFAPVKKLLQKGFSG
jgi:ribonuclease HII